VPGNEPLPVAVPLPDGDELWNATRAGEYLGVSAITVWGYANKRLPKTHPFPEPEPDPVALIVPDPVQAAAVRLLAAADARVARGHAGPEPPRLWRATRVKQWHAARPGRGNWR
jgi:hypothetical protein